MPADPPLAYATISNPLPSRPYILQIHPSSSISHLILRHPSPDLTITDAQTLQPVGSLKGHTGNITCLAGEESLYSGGRDCNIIRWDERSRNIAMKISANIRKPIPITSMTISESDYLVIGGTELVSSEAHIIFWYIDQIISDKIGIRETQNHRHIFILLHIQMISHIYQSYHQRNHFPELPLSIEYCCLRLQMDLSLYPI
jgi:WD40 repeat protein